MRLTPEENQSILNQFIEIQTTKDLLILLNNVKNIKFANNTQAQRNIEYQTITSYFDLDIDDRYNVFWINKRNGSRRSIYAPKKGLKTIQQCLSVILYALFDEHVHEASTGFTLGKSIVDNARPHVCKPFIYNLDLKDFFESINYDRVKNCLLLPPFNLDGSREQISAVIASLCCVRDPSNYNNIFLPQGAPTSPVVSNIICQKLDQELSLLAKRFKASYTRYADDITFSSNKNIYSQRGSFCLELSDIIHQQGFLINHNKTRLQSLDYKQEVTGLIVNERVNIPRRFWRSIRLQLYNWDILGYNKAEIQFKHSYEKTHHRKKKPSLRAVMRGRIEFLKTVRGADDALYKKYASIFEILIKRDFGESAL